MEQGKKRVFSAGFKLHEQLLFSFPSWQGGNMGVFFFFGEATVRENRSEISISVISILFAYCLLLWSSFTSASDKSRQLLRLLLLSYDETHGMLGLLHVLLLLMYSCIKCPTLILLWLPDFFLSRHAKLLLSQKRLRRKRRCSDQQWLKRVLWL